MTAKFLSRFDDTILMPITLVVVPDLLLDIRISTPPHQLKIPDSMRDKLADPTHHLQEPISILLGASVWANAVRPESYEHERGVLAQNMSFGWIFMGSVATIPQGAHTSAVTGFVEPRLDQLLERFCQLDEFSILTREERRTPEQVICEEHFLRTFARDPTGRYVVDIPIRKEITSLGRSREIALNRFINWNVDCSETLI